MYKIIAKLTEHTACIMQFKQQYYKFLRRLCESGRMNKYY